MTTATPFIAPNAAIYSPDSHPPLRALYSLESAAQMAGLTTDLLLSALKNGDIPGTRVLHLGPRRMRYLRSAPFAAWLFGSEAPTDPGIDADRAAESAVAKDFHPVDFDDSLFQ